MSGQGRPGQPAARYQRAERRQKESREFSLEQFVPANSAVRAIWAYTELVAGADGDGDGPRDHVMARG